MSAQGPTLQQPAASAPAEAGGVLTIDLAAIAANWKLLGGMSAPAECAAVVKADAYGCGLDRVAPGLVKAGCKTFFVADLAEGRRLRAIAPQTVIYVLNGVLPNTAPAFQAANLRPVINSMTELAEWDEFIGGSNWRGGAALHIDTGMNRLGLTADEAIAIAPRVNAEGHGFTLLMSHLACAEIPGHPMNDRQARDFDAIRTTYRGLPASLTNSAGIFLGSKAHCDLVRPGIALYGGNPVPGRNNPMRPVIELRSRISQVREVKQGDTVGYGGSWTAARPSRLAIVTAGYADGYFRSAAAAEGKPPAQAIVAGCLCPLVGRVSMDCFVIDVTDAPAGTARRGEFATLIGGTIGIDELGAACSTISYEVLTNLGRRYHRIYRD